MTCWWRCRATRTKSAKLVLKQVKQGVLYRMVQGGFYVGDQEDFAFYRFPSRDELERVPRMVAVRPGHVPGVIDRTGTPAPLSRTAREVESRLSTQPLEKQ